MSPADVSCRATALPAGDDVYALSFELRNATADTVEVPFTEPFMDFEILASTAEGAVEVHCPALDIPVRRSTLVVPSGGTTPLQTPVRLRIGADADVGTDGFVWTVPRSRDALTLQVRLTLPEPFDVRCPLTFA